MTHRSALAGLLAGALFVAALVGVLVLFDLDEQVLRLLRWLDGLGWRAPLLFILLMAAVVVLLLPGVLFTTGAGFVFGVAEGTIVVVLGTTLGSLIAFLLGRHLLGPRAQGWLRRHGRLAGVGEALAGEGWRVVLLTRLIPFFPSKLSNYLFGVLPFSLRDFGLGTFLGIIPYSLHNVYLGSLAAGVAELAAGTSTRTPWQWALYGLGLVAVVVAVVYLGRVARQGLARYTESAQKTGEDGCPG